MFAIIGIVVVLVGVIGGYLMEHGPLAVLFQPAEIVIIGGAALGSILVANPLPVLITLGKGMLRVFTPSPFTKAFYLDNMLMLSALFSRARKEGLAKLEADADDPQKSPVFTKHPKFLKDHHALHFVCDTLRMAASAGASHFELDQVMDQDMEVHHHETGQPVAALSTMADSLPGLGIVAAVLGVVITMGSLGGPPEMIGKKVAAALVGTFLGILMCYGFFGPIASHMGKLTEAEAHYYNFLRVGIVAFIRGASPMVAVEYARRVVPTHIRPTFREMEAHCKGRKPDAAPKS